MYVLKTFNTSAMKKVDALQLYIIYLKKWKILLKIGMEDEVPPPLHPMQYTKFGNFWL